MLVRMALPLRGTCAFTYGSIVTSWLVIAVYHLWCDSSSTGCGVAWNSKRPAWCEGWCGRGRDPGTAPGIQMVLLFLSSVFAASSDRGHDREGEENVSGTYHRASARFSSRPGQCKQPTHCRGTLCPLHTKTHSPLIKNKNRHSGPCWAQTAYSSLLFWSSISR